VNRFGLQFHHFGLAVRSPERAALFLTSLGYRKSRELLDPHQQAFVALMEHEQMPDVELIWPGNDDPSPVDRLIRPASGHIYHLCYRAADPAASLREVEAAGLTVLTIQEPRPALLFGGMAVSFHHVEGFGLMEILHQAPTAAACAR
jgi:catechol 2,3-dioxygenase-like lactoylglutathione lyase family enzyme